MLVPFLDLRRAHREIEAEIRAAIDGVLDRGVYILGREVEAFEEEWASFCGVGGAAAVASGTDALSLALIASGAVRPGRDDEVITTPLTAAYTALAILNAGGVPVFADIDPRHYTLDPEAVEAAITPRTRAIVPVHLYGGMAEMAGINQIAMRHGLVVIEDAAQAHGARWSGVRAGAQGHAAAFSFYPTKNLGAYGDGGAVVSNDLALIERVKILRQGGQPAALQDQIAGRNSRLDEMQAAILRVKLKRLEDWNRRRQALARFYDEGLGHARAALPSSREPEAHVYHLYVVQHPERDLLRAHLAEQGIETLVHYPFLLPEQPLFGRGRRRALPVSERVAGSILSLPLYPQLSIAEAQAVVGAILEFEG
jgi:dTDP-4-amino-4,6-dideoxygalactose transaminase